jgi:Cysteine-rich CPCC
MVTEKFACPCCGYNTFGQKPNGSHEICEVCFWEDDLSQLEDYNYEGGANQISLKNAQKNFIEFGACEKDMMKNVRLPTKDEQREEYWKPIE